MIKTAFKMSSQLISRIQAHDWGRVKVGLGSISLKLWEKKQLEI